MHSTCASVLRRALDLVAYQASEKYLNLAYVMDKNVPDTIIGDPTRLRQILGQSALPTLSSSLTQGDVCTLGFKSGAY